MDESEFIEETLESEQVFDGRLLKVFSDKVRLPDGDESWREYVKHPGAVVIIAVLDNGKLLFERQYRHPLRRVFLEIPAGKIDPGEHILDTARRELREETGYKARTWRHLGTLHPCIGYSDERIEIFWAEGLSFVGAELDDGEILELCELSLADALLAVRDGEITDAKTIAALLWAEKTLSGTWPLPR
ncbi:MAG: NUDIX domain-containing protein [Pseudomonadota bacterium]|uniref:NUDIX domain-containing protein n=1 Tax=Sulfuricystis thermophila TaxID=2496847 RepID=UPI0010362693|nr:NUDIX hydrolase [Sulfuricystis thermophila]MDI6749816.1 NUDIX hydrolase [Rhodocyclaceae bacterium]